MSDAQQREPEPSRPFMPPQYAIQAPSAGEGLLPWTWAAERLARSHGYWLSTTRPDGRPHVAVIWGIWLDERFYFATSNASRKGRNLAANPHCVVCPEQTTEAVMLEGVAELVMNSSEIEHFHAAYQAKYAEESDTTQFKLYRVRPLVAFATVSNAEAFPATATRWRFADTAGGGQIAETSLATGEPGDGPATG